MTKSTERILKAIGRKNKGCWKTYEAMMKVYTRSAKL